MWLQQQYHKEWNSWRAMKARCTNPKDKVYKYYGGRGITVCLAWKSFRGFFEDMGPKPFPKAELDRKDSNGNYCKDNCRWVTKQQNLENMRSNVHITRNGVTKTAARWGRKLGIPKVTVVRRHRAGKPIDVRG